MHLESTLSLKDRHAAAAAPAAPNTVVPPAAGRGGGGHRLSLKGPKGHRPAHKGRAPLLGEVGKRQTLNVFSADGRDVSAEVGSEEAVVDETAFVKQPSVIFTRGKKGMHYTLLLLDYHKEEGSAPHHRLHWLITDIPGLEFASGDLSDGIVLADFEPPRVPRAQQPRLYVLMVFEQRPATPPNTPTTPTDVKEPPPLVHQGPLGRHPDLQQFLGDRSSFPLTSWLRSNSPKMARIAACQQFRAHLSGAADLSCGGLSVTGLAEQQRDDQGVLADVEDSEHSSDERAPRPRDHQDHDKENQGGGASRKSKRSKLSRLRRLLGRKQHCPV